MSKENKKEIVFKPSFLMVGNVGYLWTISKAYLDAVKELSVSNSNNCYTIELLSTQCVENFLKVIIASEICLKNKDSSEDCIKMLIDNSFRKFGHRLDDLFRANAEVMNKMGIEDVKIENSNGYINEYRIFFKDGKYIYLKNLESIRYGAFASKPNLINGFNNPNLVSFLDSLSMIAFEEKRVKFNEIK
ncbi:hypothetical protein K8Q96_00140 [Candidatus Nomurabacteria bacterium]|nr:hypothetical protein [Candidatus Nomurabacteria bacterium]